jgi:hypothetical protein
LIRPIGILVLVGLVLGASAPGMAQDDRQAKEIIDAYRVWKLTDVLDLSEEDMPVFFSRVRRIGEAEEEQRRVEREAVKEIDDLLKAGASDAELESALREYEGMRLRHWEETQRLREEAASMLSLKQRCQYTVFEDRFRAEIRKMISDVRSTRGGQGGAREMPGQGETQGQRQGGSGQGGSGQGRR